MRNKILLMLMIWVSTICLTVPRHGEAVVSTVGRASISHPANSLGFTSPMDEQINRKHFELEIARLRAEEKERLDQEARIAAEKEKAAAARRARVVSQAASPASAYDGSVWDRLAQCESGGNWAINTGNGYYGGLQFSLSSWRGVGGTGYPHENSRETQIEMGKRLQASGGWGHWPACSRKLGLR